MRYQKKKKKSTKLQYMFVLTYIYIHLFEEQSEHVFLSFKVESSRTLYIDLNCTKKKKYTYWYH